MLLISYFLPTMTHPYVFVHYRATQFILLCVLLGYYYHGLLLLIIYIVFILQ